MAKSKEEQFLKKYTDLCNKYQVHIVNGGKYGLGLQKITGKIYKTIEHKPETASDNIGIIPIITVIEG